MSTECKCKILPEYTGGGDWLCPECDMWYNEEDFNHKVLCLKDDEIDSLKEALDQAKIDLIIVTSNIRHAMQSNPKWEGVPEVLERRVRKIREVLDKHG